MGLDGFSKIPSLAYAIILCPTNLVFHLVGGYALVTWTMGK